VGAAKAFKLGLLDEGGVRVMIGKAASELEASTKSTSDQVRKQYGERACSK
jgi:preprotein translocase subunit SecD